MGGIYDGPYNHDCDWLECGLPDCQQLRNRASENALIDANVNRDGSPRGLEECGYGRFSGGGCAMRKGHASRYHRRGGGVGYA